MSVSLNVLDELSNSIKVNVVESNLHANPGFTLS